MPRFVLLKHLWNGIHWDLMLEEGGGLQTWAIDAPVVEGRHLPARALPIHRLIYLEYEGEITGDRGRVRRIDEGTYCVRVWSDVLVRIRLQGAQLVGDAELHHVGVKSEGVSSWIFRLGNLD